MKIKHKRLIIIGCVVLLGEFFALLALLAPGTSTLSMNDSKLLIPFYPLFWIAVLFCKFAHDSEKLIGFIPSANFGAYTYFFLSQFIICLVLGIIISFIAYPPWGKTKSLHESTEPPAPDN